MLQYMGTDIYKEYISKQASDIAVLTKIVQEIRSGNISPDLNKCLVKYDDIAHHIDELKKKNRGVDPLLEKGIESYKDGRIIIFNGELFSYDEYKLPSYIMFVPLNNRLVFNVNGLKKATWKKVGQDEYEYSFSNVLVELKFILVTAQIMYEILINKKENAIINDSKLMPLVTQTYVDFFKKAVGRIGSNVEPWDMEKLNYMLSKFFCIHSLEFTEKESDKIVANMYSYEDFEMSDIRMSEESIDYTNLFTFIPTMTKLLYKREIDTKSIVNAWVNSFGNTMITEVEYFPTLLTHLLVLIFGVEFVNERYDLKSKKDAIYQRLTVALK